MTDNNYTIKEMLALQREQLSIMNTTLGEIKEQTTKTNGRVSELERKTDDQQQKIENLQKVQYIAYGAWTIIGVLAGYAISIYF